MVFSYLVAITASFYLIKRQKSFTTSRFAFVRDFFAEATEP